MQVKCIALMGTQQKVFKILYRDLPDVVVDNIEGDNNLGRTCSKDFNSGYDYNSSDDNSKGDGLTCSYEKL